MGKASWLPEGLQEGFQDLINEAKPKLTKEDFTARLEQHLKNQKLSQKPSEAVIAKLVDKALSFLKQMYALEKMRRIVESADWKKRMRALRTIMKKAPVTRQLDAFETCLKKFEKQKYRLAMPLVQTVQRQTKPLRKSIANLESDLNLLYQLSKNEKDIVSGWLKPEPISQFMFEIDNYLKRVMPKIKISERRLIVGGCAFSAALLPRTAAADLDLINSRVYRAAQSFRREAKKSAPE